MIGIIKIKEDNMPKKTPQQELDDIAGQIMKTLIGFCIKKKIENPLLRITADVNDGSKYMLIFERVDLE